MRRRAMSMISAVLSLAAVFFLTPIAPAGAGPSQSIPQTWKTLSGETRTQVQAESFLADLIGLRVAGKALHNRQRPETSLIDDIQLSWTPGWGWFRSPMGEALFHVGMEEGCENYVVLFPGKNTGIVIQSVSDLSVSVSPRSLNSSSATSIPLFLGCVTEGRVTVISATNP